MNIGIIAKAKGMIIANALPMLAINVVYFGCLAPNDWNAEANPCIKWKDNTIIEIV